MQPTLRDGFLCVIASCSLACLCLLGIARRAPAQTKPAGRPSVRVLMVSDIHFEPFRDPAKAAQLAAAPANGWAAILSAAPSPDSAARFAALQKSCHASGLDTDYALLASSLRAMRADAAGARFIAVSGDLLAHDFGCKYFAAVPHATAAGYEAFAAKTLEFVLGQLRQAFPGVPVYAALGNNDSGCGDYRIDAGGAFLRETAPAMVVDIPASGRNLAQRDYAAGGYFSVALPAPFARTRLLVLDDLFMSSRYETCGGKPDPAPAAEQIAWLRTQLESARRDRERVWVMAHIPPGIDPYSTMRKMTNVCAGSAPVMFVSSAALARTIAEFGDVVRLGVFGHTHMDELRLLRGHAAGGHQSQVAVKIVPSISPVDGNNPAFVVASVDPVTAVLTDYRVIAASNQTGMEAEWRESYDFDRAYGESEISAASVRRLIAGFRADTAAATPASSEYLKSYFVGGDESALLRPFWPEYTCALGNDTQQGFRSCVCSSGDK